MFGLIAFNWWSSLSRMQQAFWIAAIVSTLLLLILLFLALLESDENGEDREAGGSAKRRRWLDTRLILFFFTGTGWGGLLLSYLGLFSWSLLGASVLFGLFLAALASWFRLGYRASAREVLRDGDFLLSTGEVLQSIPPHRNGFGKVHLNLREAPFELEAITAGQEIPRGTPVRVVDVIDDEVLLVEPIQPHYPGQRNGE